MLDTCSLQSLYQKQIEESPYSSFFEQAVYQFFAQGMSPSLEIIEECVWQETLLSEDKTIENWKQLLALNILCSLNQVYSAEVAARVRLFERYPWNQSSQYSRVLVALNHAFAQMPIPEVGPHLLESGAALIALHEYCPWLSLPYTPYHFELGFFLSILALLTKREDLQEVVTRMARWQFNTLDMTGQPLAGLFVRESEGKTLQNICLSYLFFYGAASLQEQTSFSEVAQAMMKCLQARDEQLRTEKIHPLWPLIERWLEQYKIESTSSLSLSEGIYDPSTALVGYRSSALHAICTLHGEHTGLGTLRHGDVEIVTYGPQYLPLGECQGFGIEGNSLSDQGMRRSVIEWRRQSFTLRGCTRLVDQPFDSLGERGKFRGIWLEVSQEFKRPHFHLKTTFLGLDGWESVAFSFFVKASRCQIQSDVLLPRTLKHYNGGIQTLIFEGTQGPTLELRALSFKGNMQVIPLAGGNNFWGADFLVAYTLTSDQRHYNWHVLF